MILGSMQQLTVGKSYRRTVTSGSGIQMPMPVYIVREASAAEYAKEREANGLPPQSIQGRSRFFYEVSIDGI